MGGSRSTGSCLGPPDPTVLSLLCRAPVLEVVKIAAEDPDPHGMCIHEGHMYYCDAGLTETSPGSAPGYLCRFPI